MKPMIKIIKILFILFISLSCTKEINNNAEILTITNQNSDSTNETNNSKDQYIFNVENKGGDKIRIMLNNNEVFDSIWKPQNGDVLKIWRSNPPKSMIFRFSVAYCTRDMPFDIKEHMIDTMINRVTSGNNFLSEIRFKNNIY